MNVAVYACLFKDARFSPTEGSAGSVFFDFGSLRSGNPMVESRLHLSGTRDDRVTMLRKWALTEGYALTAIPDDVA